jgi:rhodanese-related sulfurtransferase
MKSVDVDPIHAVSPSAFAALLGQPDTPFVLDVRRAERYAQSSVRLPLARHVEPQALTDWMQGKAPKTAVVYCVYGHEVSQGAAAQLRAAGWDARYLLGGIEGGEPGADSPQLQDALAAAPPVPRLRKRPDLGVTGQHPSTWITRERPKIDRIACPWLIRRFIDRDARFMYLPADEVLQQAQAMGAVAYDMAGGPISHQGGHCSFDALLQAFDLTLPALQLLALTVRGADTDRLGLAAPAAGLLAVSLGMSRLHARDDQAMLAAMMPVYDALYSWCAHQLSNCTETHKGSPA